MFINLWNWWYPKIDSVEMQSKSIANLEVLANRDELLKKLPAASVGAELGVEYGHFSKSILQYVNPSKLFLVDLWKNQQIFKACKAAMSTSKQVEFCLEDSVDFLKNQKENSLDWIYIDTDHGYSTTFKELVESSRVVKDEGLICGHDYVHISGASIRAYGVIPAVHKFCNEYTYEMVFLTHEAHRHLSFALRKMP
ncbi:MAG: class I SAM-dependent methyltransferase [Bacteroidia bacterium]